MGIIPLIALCVSGIALVISALSLWFSSRAQHHTQIVSFEQRKQEVRQIIFEGHLLLKELAGNLNQFPDSQKLRDILGQMAILRHEHDSLLNEMDKIPSSPSTQARLKLEQVGGMAIQINKRIQDT